MDSKQLNDYFKQISEMERKAVECKKYLDSLKTQIKEREDILSSVRYELKRVEKRLESMSSQIPKSQTEVIVIELQNKTFCKQIEIFEEKNLDLRQKMCEMNEKRRQRIHSFREESFSFCRNYGINGIIRTQNRNLEKQIQSFEEKRNELNDKNESLDRKHFEAILMEDNSLNHRIDNLKTQKTILQNENSEWTAIDLRLRRNLKQLKDNDSKQLFDLRKQLQKFEEIESNESHTEREPPVVQISDSNDSSDEKDNHSSQPVVPTKQNKRRPQSDSNTTPNERIETKKQIKSEYRDRDESLLWEIIRQRNLRRTADK